MRTRKKKKKKKKKKKIFPGSLADPRRGRCGAGKPASLPFLYTGMRCHPEVALCRAPASSESRRERKKKERKKKKTKKKVQTRSAPIHVAVPIGESSPHASSRTALGSALLPHTPLTRIGQILRSSQPQRIQQLIKPKSQHQICSPTRTSGMSHVAAKLGSKLDLVSTTRDSPYPPFPLTDHVIRPCIAATSLQDHVFRPSDRWHGRSFNTMRA
ncbi:hypothetical protein JOL62DRAFT_332164 [Phyllosticta paracitricarpa]|uniref:Uncharacterized protein n=1 Tax=Phyllosticta paracitricarpa TaxID=2016321 RepID=A0ABR1MUF2_9PEZI